MAAESPPLNLQHSHQQEISVPCEDLQMRAQSPPTETNTSLCTGLKTTGDLLEQAMAQLNSEGDYSMGESCSSDNQVIHRNIDCT